MFETAILDVLVGLVLIYLLLSLSCSALMEFVNVVGNRRGEALERRLTELMGEAALAQFRALPGFAALKTRDSDALALIRFIRRWGMRLLALLGGRRASEQISDFPAYIPEPRFAELASEWRRLHGRLREAGSDEFAGEYFDRQLAGLWTQAGGVEAEFRRLTERWFSEAMQRMSGRFRQQTNAWTAALALLLVVATNANTLTIVDRLYSDKALREALSMQAQRQSQQGQPLKTSTLKQSLQATPLLGWQSAPAPLPLDLRSVLETLVGYLLTTLALMLGADFWFNSLKKLIQIRSSLRPELRAAELPAKSITDTGAVLVPSAALPAASLPVTAAQLALMSELAECAALAYELDQRDLDKPLGTCLPLRLERALCTASGAQALVLRRLDDAHQIVAFRGMALEQLGTLAPERRYAQAPWASFAALPPAAHDLLIHREWGETLNPLFADLSASLGTQSRLPLYLVGHGTGGALAMLAAYGLSLLKNAEGTPTYRLAGVYSFGQPRAGNGAFADAYDLALLGKTFRVVNHRDGVARLCPRRLGYRHAGQCLYLDEAGRLHRDPAAWFQCTDRIDFDAMGDVTAQLLRYGLDHPIARYRERIDNLAPIG